MITLCNTPKIFCPFIDREQSSNIFAVKASVQLIRIKRRRVAMHVLYLKIPLFALQLIILCILSCDKSNMTRHINSAWLRKVLVLRCDAHFIFTARWSAMFNGKFVIMRPISRNTMLPAIWKSRAA